MTAGADPGFGFAGGEGWAPRPDRV